MNRQVSHALFGNRAATAPLISELTRASWRPLKPTEAGHTVAMLVPGFTSAYWMHVHCRCYTTIAKWKAKARRMTELDPELRPAVAAAMCSITPADGMLMSRMRGPAQMPFWARLAVVEYRKLGYGVTEIARAFQCSPRTVGNVVRRSLFLSPHRVLTEYQRNPPAKRTRTKAD